MSKSADDGRPDRLRAIEGRMPPTVAPKFARCCICEDKILPRFRCLGLITYDPKKGAPLILYAHHVCAKKYVVDIQQPEPDDWVTDDVVRKFWIEEWGRRKGLEREVRAMMPYPVDERR